MCMFIRSIDFASVYSILQLKKFSDIRYFWFLAWYDLTDKHSSLCSTICPGLTCPLYYLDNALNFKWLINISLSLQVNVMNFCQSANIYLKTIIFFQPLKKKKKTFKVIVMFYISYCLILFTYLTLIELQYWSNMKHIHVISFTIESFWISQ